MTLQAQKIVDQVICKQSDTVIDDEVAFRNIDVFFFPILACLRANSLTLHLFFQAHCI